MSAMEQEWKNKEERLKITINNKNDEIKSKNAEIKNLEKRTNSLWELLLGGAFVGVMLFVVLVGVLLLTGDMEFSSGGFRYLLKITLGL
jgi:hypothetical protein